MVVEHAHLPVRPGQEAEFEAAFEHAKAIIAKMTGFRSLTLSHCIEHPSTYLLLVDWARLEDHTEGFRGSRSGAHCCTTPTTRRQRSSTTNRSTPHNHAQALGVRSRCSNAEKRLEHLDDKGMVVGLRQAGDGDAADHADLADPNRERAAVCCEQPWIDAQLLVQRGPARCKPPPAARWGRTSAYSNAFPWAGVWAAAVPMRPPVWWLSIICGNCIGPRMSSRLWA